MCLANYKGQSYRINSIIRKTEMPKQMMSPEEAELNQLNIEYCAKMVKAILDTGKRNVERGQDLLKKMNKELETLDEHQKEHETCTSGFLGEIKKMAEHSVANLTSKVLSNSFDKNLASRRINEYKEELKSLVASSDAAENNYFAVQENISLLKDKVMDLGVTVQQEEQFIHAQEEAAAKAERERQRQKEEAERQRQEEEETERLRQEEEEAERQRQEEEETERLRQEEEEAERQRQEEEEAERQRQEEEEAERQRQEEEEAERQRQEEEAEYERQRKMKAERDRKRRAEERDLERQRKAREEAENDRKRRAEERDMERQRKAEEKAENDRKRRAEERDMERQRKAEEKAENDRKRRAETHRDRQRKSKAVTPSMEDLMLMPMDSPTPKKTPTPTPSINSNSATTTPKKYSTPFANKAATPLNKVSTPLANKTTPTTFKSTPTKTTPLANKITIVPPTPVYSHPKKPAKPPMSKITATPAPKKFKPNTDANKTMETELEDNSFWDDD